MSMPPSSSRSGSYTEYATQQNGQPQPGYPKTYNVTVRTCDGVQPVRRTTPFRYRIKAWVYRGQVYTRTKGYIPKTIRYNPNTWRDPKPYAGSFSKGDIDRFYGTRLDANNLYPTITTGVVGDLDVYQYGINCPAIPSFDSGLGNEAVIKALGKLKSQSVNLAVAFAERKETAELLIGTLAGLTKAARSLRRGDMRGVATGLGLTHPPKRPGGNLAFSEKWLELQYGWQPLYNDVFGCVSALHERDQDDAKRYVVTAKGKVKRPFRTSNKVVSGTNAPGRFTQTEGYEGAFCRLDYYLENPFLASLASLGITNPAEVVWERVPFSFAVDWFLPVGRYLSSLDAALGYKFRGGSLTQLFRRDFYGCALPGIISSNIRPIYLTGCANVHQVAINRSVYGSSPLPRVPGFKNPFPQNGIHIANAISLFASSMRLA